MFGSKIELSNPFQTKNLQSDIDMSIFFGQKVAKKQEDKFPSFSNPSSDTFPAEKAASSLRQTVDRHSKVSGEGNDNVGKELISHPRNAGASTYMREFLHVHLRASHFL